MSTLQGKIVCISGASAGIGAATAHAFARTGAKLLLIARRAERLKELVAQLSPAQCHFVTLDVSDREAVAQLPEELPKQWREISILVNNAGLARGLASLHEGEIEDWEEMIDTNIKGVLYLTRALVPGMVQRKAGQIINVGSVAGREVYPKGVVYCATKYALRAITEGLRKDLLGSGVRISTVDPGLVQTEFSAVRFRGDKERAAKTYQSFPPLQPEDVADAILYCATRPPHVNMAEMLLLPTAQASTALNTANHKS